MNVVGRVTAAAVLAGALAACTEPSSAPDAEVPQVAGPSAVAPAEPDGAASPTSSSSAAVVDEKPNLVTAHATYRQRIMMIQPLLEGRILDVTDPEAEIVIAEHNVTALGPKPYRMDVPYDPDAIQPDHAYVVEVQIKGMFKAARQAVITRGNPLEVWLDLTTGEPWVDYASPARPPR
jgi:uncharacterized lipoprotein YbaY